MYDPHSSKVVFLCRRSSLGVEDRWACVVGFFYEVDTIVGVLQGLMGNSRTYMLCIGQSLY